MAAARGGTIDRGASHGGQQHALPQPRIALAAGSTFADHYSPDEATLHGCVGLTTATDSREASAGNLLVIPAEQHVLGPPVSPKDRADAVEALRVLRVARRSAVAARAQAQTG